MSAILGFPREIQAQVFHSFIDGQISQIQILSTVCQTWNSILKTEADSKHIWKSIFKFNVKNLTFCMDLSRATTHKEKVKLFVETRERDFKSIQKDLDGCLPLVSVKSLLDRRNDSTAVLKSLIQYEKFESVALSLLYAQLFDPNQIAEALHESIMEEAFEGEFCLQILFKLGHDLKEYIHQTQPINARKLQASKIALIPQFNGLCITDLLKSGYDFSSIAQEDENLGGESFFSLLLMMIFICYKEGDFSPDSLQFTPTPLMSERFEKFKKQAPPSEAEARQFLIDLIVVCDLDLNTKMTPMSSFLPLGGTFLTLIERMANQSGLPLPNLFSDLLKKIGTGD